MLAKSISAITTRSPAARRLLWRVWYDFLGGRFQQGDWTFMNYGYEPLDADEPRADLGGAAEEDRRCIQMYEHLARAVPLRGKVVVEVGSGRGGGCAWVHTRHAAKKMRGVDFSGEAVALCRRRHRHAGLSFVQGDAEKLPLGSGRIDAVVNVESSHCYASRERFIRQVARVLRPGGHFLYTDFFSAEELRDVRRWLEGAGLRTVQERDITPNVLRAMELDTEWKRARIRASMPRALAGLFEQFAGLKDSEVYHRFQRRDLTYMSWILQKPV